ncbi:hypothetical protein AQPE_4840 [Aquipluma nitroreducens]|uniref:Uncharacterized protein n=1 Tax=Aquipluma nitroreducens TaxID=2010828 RepID=A0A5K7SGM1_9BACT|nr:hypothetical protein AQPE_4840 [Aquipluma nitroreducens]
MDDIPPGKIFLRKGYKWDETKKDQKYSFHSKIFISTNGMFISSAKYTKGRQYT